MSSKFPLELRNARQSRHFLRAVALLERRDDSFTEAASGRLELRSHAKPTTDDERGDNGAIRVGEEIAADCAGARAEGTAGSGGKGGASDSAAPVSDD